MRIGMPVYDDVDMLDVTGPYEMFGWAGFEIDILAERTGLRRFRNGFSFQVDKSLSDAGRYDAIWVPGGDPGALTIIMGDPERTYLDFLIAQSAKVGIMASVCEGAMLLAAAGLLDGYVATTHWAFIPCLLERFPKVKVADGYPRFCHDRNRLTGGGISAGLDEALRLIEILTDTNTAAQAQIDTQYYPQPPVTSVIPGASTCSMPPVKIPPPRSAPGA
jgi:transcriptional regulator GlxA family with amidase domain